ncbi:hypothetical protein ACOSP7_001232 [Xanthoceras sorbifolium]
MRNITLLFVCFEILGFLFCLFGCRLAKNSTHLIGDRLSWSRNYAAKDNTIGVQARALMLRGVEELADAVKVTMGPYSDLTTLDGFIL